jgi:hypothetical protein
MKRRLLVVIAVAVFLLFLGTSGYEALCPPYYWYVECVVRDGGGKTEFWRKSGNWTSKIRSNPLSSGPRSAARHAR